MDLRVSGNICKEGPSWKCQIKEGPSLKGQNAKRGLREKVKSKRDLVERSNN